MTDKDQCRSAFEAFAKHKVLVLIPAGDDYRPDLAQHLWMGWQAAWSHQSAALAAAQEREAKLLETLASFVANHESNNGSSDLWVYHAYRSAKAALSQPNQAPTQGETAKRERVQHTDDAAVDRFAVAMKAKMAKSREKGRSGWDDPKQCSLYSLWSMLLEHIDKGDPVDVGNFAMMIFNREATAPKEPK